MTDSEKINYELEAIRKKLLDIGLRGNTLLNFRPNANKKNIVVVDEKSAEIFNILVNDKKGMSFKSIPKELESTQGELLSTPDEFNQQLSQSLEEIYDDKRHTDTKLQTKFPADELRKRLLRIQTEAKGYIREQGIDVLYLALGFLEWYEDKAPEKPRKAPLILIPVSLGLKSAVGQFKINYTEADLAPNLSLINKLKEFNLEVPDFETYINAYIDIDKKPDITSYFEKFSDCISLGQDWQIRSDEIALGFFLFGQFKMYEDLDPKNWLGAIDNEVIKNLLCDDSEWNDRGGGESSNDYSKLEATDLHFVKDADPSQTKVILDAKQGANLVIHGPPGTGKSQTITNIISEALADNKTVLFVAEKMAALEVVKKRLDECRLGSSVLELHSAKANKKAVAAELQRTLDIDVDTATEVLSDFNRGEYIRLRKQLDKYCQEIKQPILNSDTNFVDSFGSFMQLERRLKEYKKPTLNIFDLKIPDFNFEKICNWKHEDFIEAHVNTSKIAEHLKEMETIPEKSPFARSKLEEFSPELAYEMNTLIIKALDLLKESKKMGSELSSSTGIPIPLSISSEYGDYTTYSANAGISIPVNISDIENIMHTTKTLGLDGISLSDNELEEEEEEEKNTSIKIKDINIVGEEMTISGEEMGVVAGKMAALNKEMAEFKSKHYDQVAEKAWTAELEVLREIWDSTGWKRMRFLSIKFLKAKRALKGLMKDKLPDSFEDCLLLINDILKHQSLYKKYQVLHKEYQNLDEKYQIPYREYQLLYKRFTACLYKKSQALKNKIKEINKILMLDIAEFESFQELHKKLKVMHNKGRELMQMTRYNHLRRRSHEKGYKEIAQATYSWDLSPDLLVMALQKTWFLGLLNEAYNKFDSLKQFSKFKHENAIKEFRELDKELILHTQKLLELRHFGKLKDSIQIRGREEVKLIKREARKRMRHIPIRELIFRAGYHLQQIKPVFMMSPMSVATYLAKDAIDFDLVIFDEASQVKVPHAIGSILRAKQVVMVGDPKQLPPTNFFQRSLEAKDTEEEESDIANIESILDMFIRKEAPEAKLRWHYRSLDDSLIAVSNSEFYANKLQIFPNAGTAPGISGLGLEYTSNSPSHDSNYPPSIYERGTSKTNPVEAAKIAAAVMEHAKNTPEITLGVVAFSTAQRDCILEKIDWLRQVNPTCEAFFNSNDLEDFFVKNLENVQGDERDVIFISIGYGKDAYGKLNQNFGPLNSIGGERRLNVLITRARKTMTVFSNFKGLDLRIKQESPDGVKVLKNFLIYAETREMPQIRETDRGAESPFEDEVISVIKLMGYEVESQLGVGAFRIDIAVIDPNKPGRYMLAVECDGATYHSSLHARARDRLRQNALEDRGWRFHRIWSTEWWNDQEEEIKSLKTSIEDSIKYYEELDMDEES